MRAIEARGPIKVMIRGLVLLRGFLGSPAELFLASGPLNCALPRSGNLRPAAMSRTRNLPVCPATMSPARNIRP